MKCFKTRESIIRERIDELWKLQCDLWVPTKTMSNSQINEYNCYDRAINRMYKLINPKK